MGRVSDMAIGLQEDARDELLCEIDHWKIRAEKAENLLVRVGKILNRPQKAGPKWATYSRPYMQMAIDEMAAFLNSKKP